MNDLYELKTTNDILTCIEDAGASITRAEIAKKLKLSRTTVSTAVADLMQLGLVQEQNAALEATPTNGPGRPGIPLKLRTDQWYAVGASFHTSTWFFTILNLAAGVVYRHSLKLPALTPEMFIHFLLKGLRHVLKKCPGRLLPLIGIGLPGLIDDRAGVILHAEDLGWHNIPVAEIVWRELRLPAVVLNRHRACALAEFNFYKKVDHFIYLGIDTGIIASVIIDGRPLTGTNHYAGEIGHTIVDPNGPQCQCGKHGCLQAMASLNTLNRLIREEYHSNPPSLAVDVLLPYLKRGDFIPGEVIMDAACNQHPVALAALREISKSLGIAIGNLINLLNPQTIVLGGSLTFSRHELLTDLVREEVTKYAMVYPFSVVQIHPSRLGIYSGAIGAASLPLERKLELVLRATQND